MGKRVLPTSTKGRDNVSLNASFKYDALGRRIQKTITHTDTVTDTMYLYDGLDIVQEIENGTVMVNYIRTLKVDEPLARIKADGIIRYYQQNALGSVIALTDETGTIKTQYSYEPFGNVTISGEPSDNPFQYTGRENDGTGLHYYRARYYSPELHRFISEDPIGLAGGINLYAYVGNNPVNFVDPLGWDRYKICEGQGSIKKWLCKKTVDKSCGTSQGTEAYCCDVDRTSCLCDIDPNDPQFEQKAKKCFEGYSKCMLGIK